MWNREQSWAIFVLHQNTGRKIVKKFIQNSKFSGPRFEDQTSPLHINHFTAEINSVFAVVLQ